MHYYILHLRLSTNEIAFDLPLSDTFRAKKKAQSSHETYASAKDGRLYIIG